jgi:hypothetical protein
VEASLRQSLLLAESSAPALSRISSKQRSSAFDKEASESTLLGSSSPHSTAPIGSTIRRSGMGGYDSYSAMRAALVGGGSPESTTTTTARVSQRPAGSARKRSTAHRPATSQAGRSSVEYGRSSVMGGVTRGPQFARWATGGAAATVRPSTTTVQAQRGGVVPAFGPGWAAAAQPAGLDLVSHGKAMPLSPRS